MDKTDGYLLLGFIVFHLIFALIEYWSNPDTNFETTKNSIGFWLIMLVVGYIFYVVFMGGFRDFI